MSVVLFSIEEISRIANTVIYTKELKELFKYKLKQKYCGIVNKLKDRDLISEIKYYFIRLHIANQVAYSINYIDGRDNFIVEVMEIKNLGVFPIETLLKELKSLRYNLYTNNGNCFAGEEDMELLDELIETTKDIILENMLKEGNYGMA